MKVAIGTKIQEGPWGGGNLFAINLSNFLIKNGHEVVYDLKDNDIDIILLTEPRKTSLTSSFNHKDIQEYIDYKNKSALVFHRINECDERKGTDYLNQFIINSNKCSDISIFVSNWLKNLYVKQGVDHSSSKVILAGADKEIFNSNNSSSWNGIDKLKIITHHWGTNLNKGFNIYKFIDNMLNDDFWNKRIEFSFLGNTPKNFSFENTRVIKPTSGIDLANTLKEHHLYITGSLFEPSGNHHIEAAQCGLPVFYIPSGGTTEYCKDFGIPYSLDNLEKKLNIFMNDYEYFYNKMKSYPFNAEKMCQDYINLFTESLDEKNKIITKRIETNKNIIKWIIHKFKLVVFNK